MARAAHIAALAAVVAGALAAASALARDGGPGDAGVPTTDAMPPIVQDQVEGGKHWRLETDRGVVHVWLPPGYREETAAIVVYAHGFGDTPDSAWTDHKLAAQFAASKRNALFIVPRVRTNGSDSFKWRSLGHLIHTIQEKTGLRRPWGRVVAVGHSGAYRSLVNWMEYPPLDRIILLDGLYAAEEDYARFLSRPRNRLIMVAADTFKLAEPFMREHGAVVLDYVPETATEIPAATAAAHFLYLRSQYDHMQIVTAGKTIPVLLAWIDIPAL